MTGPSLTKSGFLARASLSLLAAALVAGCRRDEIAVYRVPKEQEPEWAGVQGGNGEPSQPPIQWKTPAGWEEESPGGMSIASFSIAGEGDRKAQLSVMKFPGEGASELSLVNIVRENAGLAPLNDDDLDRLVEAVNVGAARAKLIDLTGAVNASGNASPNRILVAVFPRQGTTWFFKLAGDSAVVSAQKQAFLDFLKSVTFAPSADTSGRGAHFASTNAKGIPRGRPGDAQGSDDAPGKPFWEVPAGWQAAPAGQMVLAKFLIGGTKVRAEVTVSAFPGDAGGLLDNLNRWRGQVGLARVDQGEADRQVAALDVLGGKAMLVDVDGRDAKTGEPVRLIGVIVPREGQTWFYKLKGDPEVAGREKNAFIKFVQTVRYPNV